MPKKILIAMPPAMLKLTDDIAAAEHRTRSDLIREAIRRYIQSFQKEQHLIGVTTTQSEASDND